VGCAERGLIFEYRRPVYGCCASGFAVSSGRERERGRRAVECRLLDGADVCNFKECRCKRDDEAREGGTGENSEPAGENQTLSRAFKVQ